MEPNIEGSAEDELPEAAEEVQPAKGHDGALFVINVSIFMFLLW